MVVDALRAYVQLASGLTDVTRERAVSAAKALVAQVGAMSDAPAESTAQVRALADELAKMARTNRDVVIGMVRAETERAVASVGVASSEDLVALQRRVSALENELSKYTADADSGSAGTSDTATESSVGDTAADSSARDQAATPEPTRKRAAAKKSAVKKAGTDSPPAPEATAAQTSQAPPDPAHATPADMPQHEPASAVGAAAGDAPLEDAPADDGAAKSTSDDQNPTSAPQDPSPPDVSTS